MKKTLGFWIVALALISCKSTVDRDGNFKDKRFFREAHTGWDYYGKEKTCQKSKIFGCPIIDDQSQAYTAKCKEEGYEVFQCGCNDYLCSNYMEDYPFSPLEIPPPPTDP
jgi:hypothetical protein